MRLAPVARRTTIAAATSPNRGGREEPAIASHLLPAAAALALQALGLPAIATEAAGHLLSEPSLVERVAARSAGPTTTGIPAPTAPLLQQFETFSGWVSYGAGVGITIALLVEAVPLIAMSKRLTLRQSLKFSAGTAGECCNCAGAQGSGRRGVEQCGSVKRGLACERRSSSARRFACVPQCA
jgi:hypothetical protein